MPEQRLAAAEVKLDRAKARYELRRQVLFYLMFFVQMVVLTAVVFVALQVRALVREQSTASAGRAARLSDLVADIARERRADTDAQTIAIEQFILDVASGKDPAPTPLGPFNTVTGGSASPGGSSSTPKASPSPQRAASPRPGASSKPMPVVTVQPSPSPSPAVGCVSTNVLRRICI
jgi:hypothetical protein